MGTRCRLCASAAVVLLGAREARASDHSGGGYASFSGLRVNLLTTLNGTDLSPQDASKTPAGVMLWQDGAVWGSSGFLGGRLWGSAGLGAGSTGLEGALGGGTSIGAFVPIDAIAKGTGPFLRVGFDGEMMGNQLLYLSWIEAPQGRVGFQLFNSAIEVGMHAGPVLAGRFNLGNAARRDDGGGFEYGPYVSLGPVDVSWMHILPTSSDQSPVDIFRANAGFVEVWYVHGSTQFGVPTQTYDSTAIYLGIGLAWLQKGSL
jgi:hypothetical protein